MSNQKFNYQEFINNCNKKFIENIEKKDNNENSINILSYLSEEQQKELAQMYSLMLDKFICEQNEGRKISLQLPIYTVTTMEKVYKNEHGWPEFGDIRLVGFYFNDEFAKQTIELNICDIHEGIYQYAVIEKFYPGLYSHCSIEDEVWYKWNKEKKYYEQIKKPEDTNHVCNFAFG